MSVNTCDDFTSVIDWFANEEGRCTPMSGSQTRKANHYRISLHSIDDDELRMFQRDLVTPAPSVCYDDDMLSRNILNQRPMPTRPASRTESVMLFKKISNGDEVVSCDLVSSELRDFLDTDFMMDGILSRPVSRTTIFKNASKIQDINKFRNTLQKKNDFLPAKKLDLSSLETVGQDTATQAVVSLPKKKIEHVSLRALAEDTAAQADVSLPKKKPEPLLLGTLAKDTKAETDVSLQKRNDSLPKKRPETLVLRTLAKDSAAQTDDSVQKKKQEPSSLPTLSKDTVIQIEDSLQRYNNYSYITPPKSYKKNQPESVPQLRPKAFTKSFVSEPVHEQRFPGSKLRESRLSEQRLSEQRISESRLHEQRLSESRLHEQRLSESRLHDTRLYDSRLHDTRLHESRLHEPKLRESRYSEPRLPELKYSKPRLPESRYAEPRIPELKQNESRYGEATRLSESRHAEPTRLRAEPRLARKPKFNTDSKTRRRDRMRSETVSSSSSSEEEEFWMQRSSQLLKNIRNDPVQETLGKLKPKSTQEQNYTVPSGHYSSPILHHRYSVPNNTFLHTGERHACEYKSLSSSRVKPQYTKTTKVADSAKQVLAGIRERRKSALVLESPKVETSTRFQSSQQDHTLVSDFRSRLQLHRESTSSNLRRGSQPNKYAPNTNTRRY